MLKTLLVGLARSNVFVDLAMDAQATLHKETQAGALAIGAVGFGLGMLITGILWDVMARIHPGSDAAIALGTVVGVAGAIRTYLAHQRLTRLKNLISAKSARDAAGKAAAKGADLVSQGVTFAGETLGNMMRRKPENKA